MAALPTQLMTVEEFRRLAEDAGPFYHELRHGVLVTVTRPKYKHFRIRQQLEKILEAMAGNQGVVAMEFTFRPRPEHELWVADVGYIAQERWDHIDPEDNLMGAPELVFEVLSPSNTAAEMLDKEQICLSNGAREFWVIDPERRYIRISTSDGKVSTYRAGQEIPLALFGNARLSVDAIFA